MKYFSITTDILGESFSGYKNGSFIKIDLNSSYDYGLSYHYNYYCPPEVATTCTFMGHSILKAGFNVEKDNSIEEVILFLEVFDIDFFYKGLVKKYGKPEIASLSKFYIEQQGFKIPSETESVDENYYDSIPKPQLEDYKNLKNVNWYEVNSSSNKVGTNLIVRNQLKHKITDIETHEVQIIIRKSKN